MAAKPGNGGSQERRLLTPLERFRSFCRFDPETGCVLWTGGTSAGRGHHARYGVFWFERRRWFAHRWAAKFIHQLEIDTFQIDHCCKIPARPNTLCVEHLSAETPARNRELQTMRKFVHLQVGLLTYEEVYGPALEPVDLVPFYLPPAWLGSKGPINDDETNLFRSQAAPAYRAARCVQN